MSDYWKILVIFCLVVFRLAYCQFAYAIPHVYIDRPVSEGGLGDDANDGLSKQHPVTDSDGQYTRAIELGVLSDDTGIKINDGCDTPPAEFMLKVMRNKRDKVESHSTCEVIAGHGQLPDEDVVESSDAGFRIRIKHHWPICFTNANGPQEGRTNVTETIEVY